MNRKVTVDWSAVKSMLPVLPYVERREPVPVELVDQLIASPGIQFWLEHASRHGGFTEERYRNLLKRAETAEVPTRNRLLDILLRNAGRAEEIKRILAAILELDFEKLCDRAFDNANQFLTQPFNEPVCVYLMAATRGSAIVLENAMAIDIADFPDPEVTPIPRDMLFSTIAHEIFHMGRAQSWGAVQPDGLLGLAYQLSGALLEEGLATYLTSEGYARNNPLTGKEYIETLQRLPEIAAWLGEAFELIESGTWDEQKMQPGLSLFFNTGMYALGTEMCKAIDRVLGRDALVACMRDSVLFFTTYNQAVEAGRLDLPKLPENVVRLLEQVWIKP